jgi:hypothetical protein
MQPPAYLYVVRVTAGWAACCQCCGATITIARSRSAAERHGVGHTCVELARLFAGRPGRDRR